MESRIVNGTAYVQSHNQVRKLASLDKCQEYVFVSYDDTPTKYNTYIVTIRDQEKEFRVYMPGYIVRVSQPGRRFVYNGLQLKNDKSGHSYHQVLWAEEYDFL